MLGLAIRQCRQAKNLSQRDLAQRCGVTRETINRIETSRHIPNVKLLNTIAEALGMRGSELLRMSEDMEVESSGCLLGAGRQKSSTGPRIG